MSTIHRVMAITAGCDPCNHCDDPKEDCYYIGSLCFGVTGCSQTISVPCSVLDNSPFWPSQSVLNYGTCCYDMSTTPQLKPEGDIINNLPQSFHLDCEECAEPPPETIACCYLNGICQEQTPEECQQFGGFGQGPGSTCTPNPCLEGSCDDCANWPNSVTVNGVGFGFICPDIDGGSAECLGDLLHNVPLDESSCRYTDPANELHVVNEQCTSSFPQLDTSFQTLKVDDISCGQGIDGTPSEGWGLVWRIEIHFAFVINDTGLFGTQIVTYFRPVFPFHDGPPLGVYALEQDLTSNAEIACGPGGEILFPSTVSVI